MAFDDVINFIAGSEDPSTADAGGLTQRQRRMIGFNGLGQMGALLMAGGEPMWGPDRARFLAQIGNVPGNMQDMRRGMIDERRAAIADKRAQAESDAVDAMRKDPNTEALITGMTPAQQFLAKGALASGKFANISSAFGGGNGTAEMKNYQEYVKSVKPGEKAMTFPEFMKWHAGLTDRSTGLKYEMEKFFEANPGASTEDFYRAKAQQTASGRTLGTEQAQAQMSIPQADAMIHSIEAQVDRVKNDPGLSKYLGRIAGRMPDISQGSVDFTKALERLKGKAFINQFQQLRGGGAITEIEGQKATDALVNLDPTQSREQFINGLETAILELKKGRDAIRNKASGAPMATGQPTAMPQGNAILDEARDAIARGAPRAAVIERLKKNGIDPSGL